MRIIACLSVLVFLILQLHGEDVVSGEDGSLKTVCANWPRFFQSSVFLSDLSGESERCMSIASSVPRFSPASLGNGPVEVQASAGARQQLVYFAVEPEVREGKTGKAMIRFKYPEMKTINFRVVTHPQGQIQTPSTVTIAAGDTKCVFEFSAKDDKLVNLTRDVALSLVIGDYPIVVNQVTVLDDETAPVLKIRIPSKLVEGRTQSVGRFTLDRPADVDFKLAIVFSQRQVFCQSNVMMRAGMISVSYNLRAIDDSIIEDPMEVSMTAWSNGIGRAEAVTKVIDNESHLLTFTLPDSVTERQAENGAVALGGYLPYDLTVMLKSDGLDYLSFPSQVTIRKGKSSATFSLRVKDQSNRDESHQVGITATAEGFPDVAKSIVARETLAAGHTVKLSLVTKDLVWDPLRGRIYASVPPSAGEPYGNHVVAIDPTTREITASVAVDQDPGQLALTSGGEALYVAIDGNGTIAKIALPDFTVVLTFAVGTDPYYGLLGAEDMCTVVGQPDLIVVSQTRKNYFKSSNGVAVYDNGVPRPRKTQEGTDFSHIEPSSDPAVFFGFFGEPWIYAFRKLQLSTDGLTALAAHGDLLSTFGLKSDIRSDGDTVFDSSGTVVDGKKMKKLGALPRGGLVCPDLANGLVFRLMCNLNIPGIDKIVVYDAVNYFQLQEFELINEVNSPESFIRWGESGLAVRNNGTILLIDNRSLIPAAPAADLVVSVVGSPNPIHLGTSLTYSINVTNQGQNAACGAVVSAILSGGQKISGVSGGQGKSVTSGLMVHETIGDLAPGEMKTLSIVASPKSTGPLVCTAVAYSQAIDPVISNNTAVGKVDVLFPTGINIVNSLRLPTNNLIYDSTRSRLWVSFSNSVEGPRRNSVASLDPLTGIVSEPLPLGASPYPGSMALSANGRYLYVGLLDVTAVHRIDLATDGHPSLRIPLVTNQWGWEILASDIEVLDGDGTSFMIVGGNSARVYDGTVMRPNQTASYSVNRIKPSGAPGMFIGYRNVNYRFDMTRLALTASGVEVESNYVSGPSSLGEDVDGPSGLVLFSDGRLVDGYTHLLKFDFGIRGIPCLDIPRERAYVATSSALHAFNTTTGAAAGILNLSLEPGEQVSSCTRWGADGFAIRGETGRIYFVRGLAEFPAPVRDATQRATQIAVQFAAHTLVQTTVNIVGARLVDMVGVYSAKVTKEGGLDYLIGPSAASIAINPVQVTTEVGPVSNLIHITFSRRAGEGMPSYQYEISHEQTTWVPLPPVEETVISTEVVDGVMIENMDAVICVPSLRKSYLRLRWNP